MNSRRQSAVRRLISETYSQMNEEDRGVVREWAQRSLVVVENPALTKSQKVFELRKVKPTKPVFHLIVAIARLLKAKTWDNQSWARRLGVGGLTVGVVSFGTQAAGVAAMGTAIGVPLALITASGAAILGLIVDEFKKERG